MQDKNQIQRTHKKEKDNMREIKLRATLSRNDCVYILKNMIGEDIKIKYPDAFKKIYYLLCYFAYCENQKSELTDAQLIEFYRENKNQINRKRMLKMIYPDYFYFKIKKEMRRHRIW